MIGYNLETSIVQNRKRNRIDKPCPERGWKHTHLSVLYWEIDRNEN